MKLNNQKTQMLCIQPALEKEVSSFLYADGQRIDSGEELKVVGFKFGKKPNVNAHFNYMTCLLYTSPSPRDRQKSRMPSSA